METAKKTARVGEDYREFELKGIGYHITGYTEAHIIGATVTVFGKMSEEERELPPADNLVIALEQLIDRLNQDIMEGKT
jgi:hypothetical protein